MHKSSNISVLETHIWTSAGVFETEEKQCMGTEHYNCHHTVVLTIYVDKLLENNFKGVNIWFSAACL